VKIFFSGIGGSGVSAIAGFMADRGHTVAGSDRLFDLDPAHPVCRRLRGQGIAIVPQDGAGIDRSFDFAVFSTAVEGGNPDFGKAQEIGLPVKTRPEYLAEMAAAFKTVAVAGTSGKSTTSGMLAFLMERLGMGPNFIGGGRVKQFKTARNSGNYCSGTSDTLVIEACESDGSIVSYRPEHTLLLNLDLDHHSVAETADMFKTLSGNTSGLVIFGGDDQNLASCGIKDTIQFTIDRRSPYEASDIDYGPFNTAFRVNGTKFEISLPGKHNVYNALACIAFLSEMDVDAGEISRVLRDFAGIERRFDIHLSQGGYLVVDDYAHNPHKIANLMETVRKISGKVCYVFQPHGYGPTRLMREGYIQIFSSYLRETDCLKLLPVYYAGGTAARDISSKDIADPVRAFGKNAEVVGDRAEIVTMPKEWESYVVFGARDDSLSHLAEGIAENIRLQLRSRA
jgi:UDP-N-acetylmuramate--alanine ligase